MTRASEDPRAPAADGLLIIAPHPDDEILGAGAIMAAAAADAVTDIRPTDIRVVIVTDGGRSDPGVDRDELVCRRARESCEGLARLLGTSPTMLFLGVPDGELEAAAIGISPQDPLGRFVAGFTGDVLATDPADGHLDHKAAFGLAARLVAAGHGDRLRTMPISTRVDRLFDPAGYEELPTGRFAVAKRHALAAHGSQFDTTTGFALDPGIVDDFCHTEYLRTVYDRADDRDDATATDHFDDMFARSGDPWGYDDTPYERDRFARTTAALAGRRYDRALELGCANGALTRQLAPLCGHLLATDASGGAIAAAGSRVDGLANVRLERRSMPGQVPPGPFDLIVASDFLYYLGLRGVVALMAELEAQAAPGCRMLIASYLGETQTRITGEMSSEIALAHLPGWRRIHRERTDKLRIDVLDRR